MPPLCTLLRAALLLCLATTTSADNGDAEVQYLLSYVAASGCTFHRNGGDHDSADAADHLRLKYSRGGKYVNSAEQFIDRLASESSWSGTPYSVTCEGVTQPSGAWLHRALQAYRQQPGS
jgi:hypothetical protein